MVRSSRPRFWPKLAVSALLGGPLLTGCHADQARAENAAHQFFKATEMGDQNSMRGVLSEKAKQGISRYGVTIPANAFGEYSIGSAYIEGETATVPASISEEKKPEKITLIMRRESGSWCITGMCIAPSRGTSIDLNFENDRSIAAALTSGKLGAAGAALVSSSASKSGAASP